MPIRSDLELDISSALTQVGTLQDAITQAFAQVSTTLSDSITSALANVQSAGATDLAINVDTSGIQQAVTEAFTQTESGLIVPVTADTSDIASALASVIDQTQTVPITADTTEATAAVSDLAQPQTIPLDADPGNAQAAVETLTAPVVVPVDADVAAAETAITGLDQAPITLPVDADTSEAVTAIEQLGLPLTVDVALDTSTAEDALGQLNLPLTVTVEADTSTFDAAISDAIAQTSSVPPVPIGADTSLFETDVANVVSQAESTTAVIPVDADTTAAETAISDVTSAAGTDTSTGPASTSGGISGIGALESATLAFSAAQGIASGSTGGLAKALGSVSTEAAAGVAGVTALTFGVKDLAQAGLTGVAAQQRLANVFGDTADAIQRINVGGLSGNLGDLAIRAGSSAQSIEQATANLGFLANNSNFTAAQTKELTNNFAALALQAVAAKPALGDAGKVMDQLVPALSRGGRSALQFGLSLSAAQVNARAMADTGITTASALTTLQKALAGAEIATEQLGGKIGTNFSRGVEQTQVQFKSLGAQIQQTLVTAGEPLVAPALELFKDLTPVAESFAKSLGSIASGVLSVAGPILSDLTPAVRALGLVLEPVGFILTGIGDLLSTNVGQGILVAAGAFTALSAAVNVLPATLAAVGSAFTAIQGASFAGLFGGLGSAGTTLGTVFGTSSAEIQTSVAEIDTSLASAVASFGAFASTEEALAAGFTTAVETDLAAALASIGAFESEAAAAAALAAADLAVTEETVAAADATLLSNPITASLLVVGAVVAGIATAIFGLGDSAKKAAPETSSLADALDKVSSSADGAGTSVVNFTSNVAHALDRNDLGDIGKELTKDNDALLDSLAGVGFNVTNLATDLSHGSAGLTDFTKSVVSATEDGTKLVRTLQGAGLTTKTIIHDLAIGRDALQAAFSVPSAQVEAFSPVDLQNLAIVQDNIEKVTHAFSEYQVELDKSAVKSLELDAIDGKLTAGQQAQLAAILASKSGYEGANGLLIEVNNGLSNQTVGLDRNTQAWALLAEQVAAGAISTDSSAASLQRLAGELGVSSDQLIQFIQNVQEADQKLLDTFEKHLPEVGDILSDFTKTQVTDLKALGDADKTLSDALEADQAKRANNAQVNLDSINSALTRQQEANQKLAEARAKAAGAGETASTQSQAASQISSANNAVASAQREATNASLALQKAQDQQAKQGHADALQIQKDQEAVAKASKDLATAMSPDTLLKNIQSQTTGISTFQSNIDTIINQFKDPRLAEELVNLGVVQGGALAGQIVANGPGSASNIEKAISANDKAQQAITDDFKTNWVSKFGDAATTIAAATAGKLGFTLTTEGTSKVGGALDAIRAVFGAGSPEFQSFLAQVSTSGAAISDTLISSITGSFNKRKEDIARIQDQIIEDQLKHGRDHFDPALALRQATKQVDSEPNRFGADVTSSGIAATLQSGIETGIDNATKNSAAKARRAFAGLGDDFVGGIVEGLSKPESKKSISDASTQMVKDAEDAARTAADSKSPSKLFAAVGSDLVLGLAQGITETAKPLSVALDVVVGTLAIDFLTRGITLGQDLGLGIETGLLTTLQPMFAAIDKVLTDTEKHARKTVKASSPSKLFAELGADISAGLATGITSGNGAVSAAASSAVNLAHTAASDAVSKAGSSIVQVGQQTLRPLTTPTPELRAFQVASGSHGGGVTPDTVRDIARIAAAEVARANKPVEITHNEKVDPLHVAAEVQWALSR